MIEQNLMLFWHSADLPDHAKHNVEALRSAWPHLDLERLNDDTAYAFLKQEFDTKHADLFASCAIPAMRSDLIRLAWLEKRGGLYLDAKFAPSSFPDHLIADGWELTCLRYPLFHQTINNSILAAPAQSRFVQEWRQIAFRNVEQRKNGSISTLTGPLLLKSLVEGLDDASRVRVLHQKKVVPDFIHEPTASHISRHTDTQHWSILEKEIGLYVEN